MDLLEQNFSRLGPGIWGIGLGVLALAIPAHAWLCLAVWLVVVGITVLTYYRAERAVWGLLYGFGVVVLPFIGMISYMAVGLMLQELPSERHWLVWAGDISCFAIGLLLGALGWRALRGLRKPEPRYADIGGEFHRVLRNETGEHRDRGWSLYVVGAGIGLASVAQAIWPRAYLLFGLLVMAPAVVAIFGLFMGTWARAQWELMHLERQRGQPLLFQNIERLREWRRRSWIGRRLASPHP